MVSDNIGGLLAFLPFLIIGVALLATFALFVLDAALTSEIMTELLIAMGGIWLIIIAVLLCVSFFCMEIHPIEHFADTIEQTEAAICKMKDEIRTFVASDLGKAGQEEPTLISQRMNVGSPTVACDSTTKLTMDERLTRMEITLDKLAEPELKKSYDATMKCEGFATPLVNPKDPNDRLSAIQKKLSILTTMYLDPILQHQRDLQSGIVSDCNKKRAADAAITH